MIFFAVSLGIAGTFLVSCLALLNYGRHLGLTYLRQNAAAICKGSLGSKGRYSL